MGPELVAGFAIIVGRADNNSISPHIDGAAISRTPGQSHSTLPSLSLNSGVKRDYVNRPGSKGRVKCAIRLKPSNPTVGKQALKIGA